MGSSSCGNLFCKYEKNIEFTTPLNQETSNNEPQKIVQNNSNDININSKDEFNSSRGIKICKQLIPNINESINDISNHQDIKTLINNINIRKIYFPLDKNKLKENNELLYEKIEKVLSKFYPCDEKELKDIELYLINIFINIKNNLDINIKENKVILCGKLQKIINIYI